LQSGLWALQQRIFRACSYFLQRYGYSETWGLILNRAIHERRGGGMAKKKVRKQRIEMLGTIRRFKSELFISNLADRLTQHGFVLGDDVTVIVRLRKPTLERPCAHEEA
jgi:hypothetical protein